MARDKESIVAGHAAIIMQSLRNHKIVGDSRLKGLVCNQFSSDDLYEDTLKAIVEAKWAERVGDNLKISEEGEKWLDESGGALDVEEEDLSSGDILKHPYDVDKLMMETKHLSVFQVLRKIEKNEINLSPDFQRAFVWDNTKKSRLIESILIRIPLPAFYLDATDQIEWSVVDGLQRLTTLYHFCRENKFSLSDLQFLPELNGKAFDELPPKYKVLIEDDTQLLFYNLMPGTPVEAKSTIFSRVNTGGMQLTAQEIRHALNQGEVTKRLARMSKSRAFLCSTQGVVESLRMSDRELVLRAVSFMHQGVEVYGVFNSLDAFLLHSMAEFNSLSDIQFDRLESEFEESVWKVWAVFGKYSFRKFYEVGGRRSPLNKALFEVWVSSVRPYSKEELVDNKEWIIDEFIELITCDDSFIRSISASTSSLRSVKTRFDKIQNLLGELHG